MISFIILPVLMGLFPGASGTGPAKIAYCRRYGSIDERNLADLNQNRQDLGRFYNVLYQLLADPNNQERMMALQNLGITASQYDQLLEPEELVNQWLLTQHAKELGMSIDKTDIINHLNQLTATLLTNTIYQQTIKAVGMSEQRFEYLITLELLSIRMSEIFEISMNVIPPSTRWDWFQRLNRQITAEVAAVPVEQFVNQITEPNNIQLQKFFNENKDKPFNPTQLESGFTVPDKIAFQYIKATPDQKILDSISDEEIKKYYEENKETLFRKPAQPMGNSPMFPTLPGQSGNLFQSGGLGGITPSSRPFPTPQLPATEENPKPEPTPPEKEPEKTDSEKPEKTESSSIRSMTTRFVSYQTETETAQNTNSGTEQPKPEEPKVEAKPEQPATETPKTDEPVDLSILYRPLDEVKEQIRSTLATEKVLKLLPVIEEKMRDYFQAYYIHLDQEKATPPMPDLTSFVAEQGLVLKTVSLDTIFGAIKSEFARGPVEREYLFNLFNEAPILFEPKKIEGENILLWVTEVQPESKPEKLDEIRDVVLKRWKEVEARSLALKRAEELAAEVRSSDKSLAETFADRQDIPVVETEPFTYKSYGASMYAAFLAMRGIPPQLGEVCEKGVAAGDSEIDNKWIVAPGVEFMETVSLLSVGETGVVFNQPQTVAYVIRVTGSSPSEEVLWERFQTATLREYYLAGQPETVADARKAWLNKIYEKVGFKWIQKPERGQRQR
ncbi:MAG: hypothetical protein LBI18_13930 [Planctomycetaceae bacterium]|nr:hypothetical protein [Planctomycetaceae bacterium]